MKCEVCGRTLRSPSSIARKMGPGCYKKTMGEQKKKAITIVENEEVLPGQINILDEVRGEINE